MEAYNRISEHGSAYNNLACHRTVKTEIPEFLRCYNIDFYPQQTPLFSYPVFGGFCGKKGIDFVYAYLQAFDLEHEFLNCFSKAYVIHILTDYSPLYKEDILNICTVVLRKILCGMLIGSDGPWTKFDRKQYKELNAYINKLGKEELIHKFQTALHTFLEDRMGSPSGVLII